MERRLITPPSDPAAAYNKFRQRVLASSNVVIKTTKQHEWDAIVRMMVAVAEREEAADSDPVKALMDALSEYLDKHRPAPWEEDSAEVAFTSNRPVERESQPWITVRHFHAWCMTRGGLADLRADDLRSRLRQGGWAGDKLTRRIGPKVLSRFYWHSVVGGGPSDD